jgi:hypothetical protein
MEQTHPSNYTHAEPTSTCQHCPSFICVCLSSSWPTWLQLYASCITWLQITISRKTQQMQIIGWRLLWWLVLWYGTSPKHYWVHTIFVTRTQQITDTLFFKQQFITQPTITPEPEDAVAQALHDLTHSLTQHINALGTKQFDAICTM